MAGLSQAQKNVFGEDAKLHPVTGMVLEKGHGAPSEFHQALQHIEQIEASHGRKVANEMRRKLGVKTPEEIAAEAKAAADAELVHRRNVELNTHKVEAHGQKIDDLIKRVEALEARPALSIQPLTASSEAKGE